MSSTPRQGLRRELRFIEAIALSLAIVAPAAAMALNATDAVNAFFYPGTMGVLLMLVSYFVCTVFPLVAAGRLELGLAIIVFVPGLARRVGEGLAREEGLAAPGTEERRSE